jgi:adenylate cyclase
MQWGEAARQHMTRWVDPGWLERMRRWFRPLEDTPSDVRAAIGRVECSAEQFLARVRVGIVALLGLVLAALALSAGRVNGSAVLIYAAYLALSISAWVLTRRGRFPLWLPWALTSLDVAFVLVVVRLGHYASMLPGSYVASLTITWSVFLLLALTTLRYNGWLVLYATALFVIGLGTIMALGQEHGISPVEVLPNLFLPGRNLVRVLLLASAGFVLALAVFRARLTLVRAVTTARERGNLARHFAQPVASILAAQSSAALRQGQQQPATVLFADIRGFTAMAEALAPADLARLLSAFRRRATRAIERHGGIVDKFIGDAVMAVFGVPEPGPNDARNALHAAVELLSEIKEWNLETAAAGLAPIHLGIGVHYGLVFAGALGDDARLEFTVIGDPVNVAQRIEELTRTMDTDLLVSDELLRAAGVACGREGDWGLQALEPRIVRGRAQVVELYEVFDPTKWTTVAHKRLVDVHGHRAAAEADLGG